MDPVLEVDAFSPKLPCLGLKPTEELHEALSISASPPQTGVFGYQLDGGAGVGLAKALDKGIPSGFAVSGIAMGGDDGTTSLVEIGVEGIVDEAFFFSLLGQKLITRLG